MMFDAVQPSLDSWALDVFYRGCFSDPLLQSFYGDAGYANLGYWDAATADAGEAGDNLVDRLVALLGEPRGTVLDVACGQGGTTRRLSRYFDPVDISAINISEPQLEATRARAPLASLHRMDAASMDFPADHFDNVVCVEAAFHFRTRRRFLEQAFRVLKPGGSLAVFDLLMTRAAPTVPTQNYLDDEAAYLAQLAEIGFIDIQPESAMKQTWDSFRLRFSDHITASRSTSSWFVSSRDLFYTNVILASFMKDALLVGARKPE